MRVPLLILLCLLAWATQGAATERPEVTAARSPQSILFVGNSLTFYNNAIYTHLRKLMMAGDPSSREQIFLKSMTISGAVLGDHQGGLNQMLNLRSWDIVVLQGHSREAIEIERSPGFVKAAEQFSGQIRTAGAEPALFMTWATADQPETTALLARAFTALGNRLQAQVIPVGLAFAMARNEIADLRLHVADRLHPSLEGTYLAAAVFYAALYGKSPAALEYTAGLDEELARLLRQIAWRTVEDYYQ